MHMPAEGYSELPQSLDEPVNYHLDYRLNYHLDYRLGVAVRDPSPSERPVDNPPLGQPRNPSRP